MKHSFTSHLLGWTIMIRWIIQFTLLQIDHSNVVDAVQIVNIQSQHFYSELLFCLLFFFYPLLLIPILDLCIMTLTNSRNYLLLANVFHAAVLNFIGFCFTHCFRSSHLLHTLIIVYFSWRDAYTWWVEANIRDTKNNWQISFKMKTT